jgi:hypothetical protein
MWEGAGPIPRASPTCWRGCATPPYRGSRRIRCTSAPRCYSSTDHRIVTNLQVAQRPRGLRPTRRAYLIARKPHALGTSPRSPLGDDEVMTEPSATGVQSRSAAPPVVVVRAGSGRRSPGWVSGRPSASATTWLGGATGPRKGARFRGHNRRALAALVDHGHGGRGASPGHLFRVSGSPRSACPVSAWAYDIHPTPEGCEVERVHVRYDAEPGACGSSWRRFPGGPPPNRGPQARPRRLPENERKTSPRTLERLKKAVGSSAPVEIGATVAP